MIPDEAVEAAARAAHTRRAPNFPWSDIVPEVQAEMLADARHILEAAAPHMMAAALNDAADALTEASSWSDSEPGPDKITRWLRSRAAAERRKATK